MNQDKILSLARVSSIETAEMFNESVYSQLADCGQSVFSSENKDLEHDYISDSLYSLYSDLIQNDYSDDVMVNKINESVAEFAETYCENLANSMGVDYKSDSFASLLDAVTQELYSCVSDDLLLIDDAMFYE